MRRGKGLETFFLDCKAILRGRKNLPDAQLRTMKDINAKVRQHWQYIKTNLCQYPGSIKQVTISLLVAIRASSAADCLNQTGASSFHDPISVGDQARASSIRSPVPLSTPVPLNLFRTPEPASKKSFELAGCSRDQDQQPLYP